MQQTETTCNTVKFQNHYREDTCINLDNVAKREAEYLQNLITQINTIYKVPTNGLIDGIGTIAKTLFGTMDVNDERHINELT
jgi:hypothetical protein